MFRLLKLKEIENGKFDFIELIKISFHFKYYIFCNYRISIDVILLFQ